MRYLFSLLETTYFPHARWHLLAFIALTSFLLIPSIIGHAFINLGNLYLNHGLDTSNSHSLTQSSILYGRANQWKKPNRTEWRMRGMIYAAQGKVEEALSALQAAQVKYEYFIWWGNKAINDGRYDDAVEWFGSVTRINPELGDYWYYLGLSYEANGQLAEAENAYQMALKVPQRAEMRQSSVYTRLGGLRKDGDSTDAQRSALDAYQHAIMAGDFADDLARADVYFQMGVALLKLEQTDESLSAFEHAVQLNPLHYLAHLQLATLIWQSDGDAQRTEALLRQAISINGSRTSAYKKLGNIYEETDRFKDAFEMYKKVLQLDPDDAYAKKRLNQLGNTDNSRN